jgi:hypothetical protein
MPVGLTLESERADARELWRIARYFPSEDPQLAALTSLLESRLDPPLFRGLCVSLDDVSAATPAAQEQRLGVVIDRVAALKPGAVVLTATSAPDAAGRRGAYFPNGVLPVRADLFGRAAWQIRTRAGVQVFADLPLEAAGVGEPALSLYDSLAKSVPFDGLVLGWGTFLAGALPPRGTPAPASWDPRSSRRARAAVDLAKVDERGRLILGVVDTVGRQQPTVQLLDTVALEDLRPPAAVAMEAADYLAVRWDGAPETAVERLRRLGWLGSPAARTLVYATARAEPGVWRAVERAGFLHRLYCPPRLPDRPEALTAIRPYVSGADFPYERR